jgi:hypothetical protein
MYLNSNVYFLQRRYFLSWIFFAFSQIEAKVSGASAVESGTNPKNFVLYCMRLWRTGSNK